MWVAFGEFPCIFHHLLRRVSHEQLPRISFGQQCQLLRVVLGCIHDACHDILTVVDSSRCQTLVSINLVSLKPVDRTHRHCLGADQPQHHSSLVATAAGAAGAVSVRGLSSRVRGPLTLVLVLLFTLLGLLLLDLIRLTTDHRPAHVVTGIGT